MATRDDLLLHMVGGFSKKTTGYVGNEVRVVGKYEDGEWVADKGTIFLDTVPLPGVLELIVEKNVEDEDITIPLAYYPVTFSNFADYDTNLGSFQVKEYELGTTLKETSFTIPAFTRAGKIFHLDDNDADVTDFGKFVSCCLTSTGNGTIAVHEMMTEGSKLFQAIKPFDLLDILYYLKQSLLKGPRPCPRCDGYGADSDYSERLVEAREAYEAQGYSSSEAMVYAEAETPSCQLCEGKKFLKDDHEVLEFMLDAFLKWQQAPYTGATIAEKIGMAFVCMYTPISSESGIKAFLSKVFDCQESSISFSQDRKTQNTVCYIGIKGEPGSNALLEKSWLQWILDTIRPVGLEYFAADLVVDFTDEFEFADDFEGDCNSFNRANFREDPGYFSARDFPGTGARFEERFDWSGTISVTTRKKYFLNEDSWTATEGSVTFGYHDIGAAVLGAGSQLTRAIDPPITENWEMVFLFNRLGLTNPTVMLTFQAGATPFPMDAIEILHDIAYIKAAFDKDAMTLKIYYTGSDDMDYKLRQTVHSDDISSFTYTNLFIDCSDTNALLIQVTASWEADTLNQLHDNRNFAVTFSGSAAQDKILDGYTNFSTYSLSTTVQSSTLCVDDKYAALDMAEGEKFTFDVEGEPKYITARIGTSITMNFGIQGGPRFSIFNESLLDTDLAEYYYTFEDNVNPMTSGGSLTTTAYEGTRALCAPVWIPQPYKTITKFAPKYCSTWVMRTDRDSAAWMLGCGTFFLCSIYDQALLADTAVFSSQEWSGDHDTTIPWVKNQWYHVELANINYSTKTYDLYIDGTLVDNYPFYSSNEIVDGVDKIWLMGGRDGVGATFYDNMLLSTQEYVPGDDISYASVIDENDASYGGLSLTSTRYWNTYEIRDLGDQFDFMVDDHGGAPSQTRKYNKIVGIKKKHGYDGFEIEAIDSGLINVDYIMIGDRQWEPFW